MNILTLLGKVKYIFFFAATILLTIAIICKDWEKFYKEKTQETD